MNTPAFIATFQGQRHRVLIALVAVVPVACAVGVVAYYVVGLAGALIATTLLLALGFAVSARLAHRMYRCPSCHRIPMRVQVGLWTKYTRYIRWYQVSRRLTIFPAWGILFFDLNPARCPACGVALAERGAEYAGAT
jgi:hypothetical protein